MAESNSNKPTTPQGQGASKELSETEKMVQDALAEAQSSLSEMQEQTNEAASSGASKSGRSGQGASFSDISSLANGEFAGGSSTKGSGIELLSDVDLQVSIELGRTQMLVEDVLKLAPGSVVELDKLAGDPVDVYVNHRLVARGEVLVLNDNFCIRISEIIMNLEEETEITMQNGETI